MSASLTSCRPLTDLDAETTIMSIDGVGAYDLISRNAMFEFLLRMEGGDQILPFVRMFCGSPSRYLWEDEMGVTQSIPQGEGGEQGDPLMPMLFVLGQHGALEATQARLGAGEYVFAYLDDIYTATGPARVDGAHVAVEEELWSHARIHLHHGKTQVRNRGGTEPSGMEVLTQAARAVKPGAVVWRGDPSLPPVQQGLKVLGVHTGHEAFVEHFLENKSTEQQVLFQRIPWVNDPQAAYLLLLMCGATRANFWLRTLRPEDTESYAIRHDENVWSCLRQILGTPNASTAAHTLSTLSLSAGGLGLASAVRVAAHWSSWADSLRMVRQRHPAIAERMVVGLEVDDPVACFRSVRVEIPHWQELADSPFPREQDPKPSQSEAGWQERATEKLEQKFVREEVWPVLSDSTRALVRSQHGPLASAPLTALPTSKATRLEAQPFRVFLCRRLHLPLPLSMRTCRCGRQLDMFGHHRAACAVAGVLGRRGFPLEVAAAQVCREAGARVSTNLHVRDMDLAEFNNLDGRRLEVVADGLTLWQGAQLAFDTTLVFPLRRDGSARLGTTGLRWRKLVVGRNAPTLNCPGMGAGLAWWYWPLRLEAGGALRPPTSWSVWRRPRLLLPLLCCRAGSNKLTSGGGAPCLLVLRSARSLLRCWTAVQCQVSGTSLRCTRWCVRPGFSKVSC